MQNEEPENTTPPSEWVNLAKVQEMTQGTLNGFAVEEVMDLIEDKLALMSLTQIRQLIYELEVVIYNREEQ